MQQDHDWEARVKRYAVALLEHRPFLDDFEPFLAEIAAAGERSALGQLLLKLTVPGLPDVYQGDELADLSLVDPDNRRPVDWDARRRALEELQGGAEPTRETMKLFVIWRALDLRARRPEAFAGAYAALDAGPGRRRVHARRRRRRGARRRARCGAAGEAAAARRAGRDLARRPQRARARARRARSRVGELVAPHGLALLERA